MASALRSRPRPRKRWARTTAASITGNGAQTALAANIDKVRQGIDGINLDEETQNLIKYQNSYQAAARTMNVLEQLLTTALGLIPGG